MADMPPVQATVPADRARIPIIRCTSSGIHQQGIGSESSVPIGQNRLNILTRVINPTDPVDNNEHEPSIFEGCQQYHSLSARMQDYAIRMSTADIQALRSACCIKGLGMDGTRKDLILKLCCDHDTHTCNREGNRLRQSSRQGNKGNNISG